MSVDYCTACEKKIVYSFDSSINQTDEGIGPYCDTCWFFVREIQALHNRITALEEK